MSTARKYSSNQRSMSRQSRNSAYAAINILWNQMRPDLKFEDKTYVREERLEWISSFLGLKKLDSTTNLTDGQIGKLLDEMKRMTGQTSDVPQYKPEIKQSANVEFISAFRASEEQKFTLDKIIEHIGWTDEQKTNFLESKKFPPEINSLTFRKANSLMMILLNVAAHKDLKEQGKEKISRKMTADYMPTLKRILQIGD